jgi:hypothetical protein
MNMMVNPVKSFPTARLPSHSNGLPVEVTLIAQLGHGSGNQLFENVCNRQRHHESFIDELDEPSAKIAGVDLSKGDATSLYTFAVGANGHPFHKHAGHRVFTAVSGSGGAQLRFSTASDEQIAKDPANFVKALRVINIPPDCMFTVRFGGETWHQFVPLYKNSVHPAFFALSCHTNELGGELSQDRIQQITSNDASIPSLTDVLPQAVLNLISDTSFDPSTVETVALSLEAPADSTLCKLCEVFRGFMGRLRGWFGRVYTPGGFTSQTNKALHVTPLNAPAEGSLLSEAFAETGFDHEDTFEVILDAEQVPDIEAPALLAQMLDSFMKDPPKGVTYLMKLRNTLVGPLGLRTSPLGCPVSSLLSKEQCQLFDYRFPVLAQTRAENFSEVLMGADDKHLQFRSVASVEKRNDGAVAFRLGTRVKCINGFGIFYLWTIDPVHRHYITPTMLRRAVSNVMRR